MSTVCGKYRASIPYKNPRFTPWIRIRMKADTDPGFGSAYFLNQFPSLCSTLWHTTCI